MASRALLLRSLRQPLSIKHTLRTFSFPNTRTRTTPCAINHVRLASHAAFQSTPNSKSSADEKIEEITELYATAQDEFEIAMEETQKMSVYAEEDRKAAREELTRVQQAFKAVTEGQDRELAEEVRRRIGQRIRELEAGVANMEELAMNQD